MSGVDHGAHSLVQVLPGRQKQWGELAGFAPAWTMAAIRWLSPVPVPRPIEALRVLLQMIYSYLGLDIQVYSPPVGLAWGFTLRRQRA